MKANPKILFLAALLLTAGTAHGYLKYTNVPVNTIYSAMGFDPTAPGNAVVLLFSDAHLCLDPEAGITPGVITTNLDPQLVKPINAISPPPTKILILGDETTSYSTCPGQLGDINWEHYCASNEMVLWLPALQAITNVAQTNILWVPGNHDQDPRETNADYFRMFFPNMPTYQVLDIAGVRFFMLNAGNRNVPADFEQKWLTEQVALTSPTQTVAVLLHQPPFASDRGNSIMLRDTFKDWPIRWWIFHGHGHYFGETVFDIGRSNVTMSGVGSANTNQFNGSSESPGFMLLCLTNGQIANRIYYHLNGHYYEWVGAPDWREPSHYLAQFEDVPGLLWRRGKDFSIPPEVIRTNIAYDEGYYYAYITEVQWELNLARHGNQATHFVVETDLLSGTGHTYFSSDRTNWVEVPVPIANNSVIYLYIPPALAALPKIYARVTGTAAEMVFGWGLVTTNPPPWITYPQLPPIPDQNAVAGRVLNVTNVAVDPYAPPDILSFALLSGPDGASVDPATGTFSWQPHIAEAPETVPVTFMVKDGGVVPMCATQQFFVSVARPAEPAITPASWGSNGFSFSVSGDPGLAYSVWASTNLQFWTLLCATTPPTTPFLIADPCSMHEIHRFYRTVVGPALAP